MSTQSQASSRRTVTPPPLPLKALSKEQQTKILADRQTGYIQTQTDIQSGDLFVSPVLQEYLKAQTTPEPTMDSDSATADTHEPQSASKIMAIILKSIRSTLNQK